MMLTWRVYSDDHVKGELVAAEKLFINAGVLMFSVKEAEPEPVAVPEVVAPAKPGKRKWKPKPQMQTLRAYNASAWSRVELVP